MTRKHFEALAREVSAIKDANARFAAAHAVLRAVRQFNANFRSDTFLSACGVP
jgi:hypothetical protein